MVRSPFSRFTSEAPAPIGHNQGPPLEPGQSWRTHCWRTARAELLPKLPLEVIRRRVARARELGLAYPQYASILTGTGRDIVAFLFTSDALGLRLARTVELPEARAEKLRSLGRCDRLLMAEPDQDPAALVDGLAERHRLRFAAGAAGPGEHASWREGGAAIGALLAPLRIPGDAVVVIGTRAHERDWADAARTAKFLPAESYFG